MDGASGYQGNGGDFPPEDDSSKSSEQKRSSRPTHSSPGEFGDGFGEFADEEVLDDSEWNSREEHEVERELYAEFDGSLPNESSDAFSNTVHDEPVENPYGTVQKLGNGKIEVTSGDKKPSLQRMKVEESLYGELDVVDEDPPQASPPSNYNRNKSMKQRPLPVPPTAAMHDTGRSPPTGSRAGGSILGRQKLEALRAQSNSRSMPVRARAPSMVVGPRSSRTLDPRPASGVVISKPGPMYESKLQQMVSPVVRAPSIDAGDHGKEMMGGRGIRRNVGRRGTMAVHKAQQRERKPQIIARLKANADGNKAAWGIDLEEGFVANMDHLTVLDYVLGSMEGDYLVRASSSSENMVLCVNDHGSLANYTLIVSEGGELEFYQKRFRTLKDVIAFAKHSLVSIKDAGKKLTLRNPATVEPWFVGETSRDDVEAAVRAAHQGQFLVRKSTAGDKFVIAVHDSGDVCNYQIDRHGTGYKFGEEPFTSLRVVIRWFKEQPIRGLHSMHLTITDPVPYDWTDSTTAIK